MNRLTLTICLVAVVAATSGCTRKPPQKFVTDKPSLKVPATEPGRLPPSTGELAARAGGNTVLPEGHWTLKIDRRISMRSTTMATTDVTASTLLHLRVAAASDGNGNDVAVTGTEASLTGLEEMPELEQAVLDHYQSLTFGLRRGDGGGLSVHAPSGRAIPDELRDALQLLIPMFPAAPEVVGNTWQLQWNRKFDLPAGARTIENIRSSWKVAGLYGTDAVMVQDFSASITGSASVQQVIGRLTGASRLGRTVCLVGEKGLRQAEMGESRTYSVVLKPQRGKKRLLEQKVSVSAILTRLDADGRIAAN